MRSSANRQYVIAIVLAWSCVSAVTAQTLDERLDEAEFLRGLTELGLPEVIEHYAETHPPADPVVETLRRVAFDRATLAAGVASVASQESTLERLVTALTTLAREHPDDPRRVIWLGDAATVLAEDLWSLDAAGVTSILGIPTAAQRRRAGGIAARLGPLVRETQTQAADTIAVLEADPRTRSDVDRRAMHRRLVEEEREVRLRLLAGTAAYARGRLVETDDARRRDAYGLAIDTLAALPRVSDPAVTTRAALFAGLAYLGRVELDDAETQLRVAAGDEQAPAEVRLTARLALLRLAAERQGAASALREAEAAMLESRSRPWPLEHLLLADQVLLLGRDAADNAPETGRLALLRRAYDAYEPLAWDDLVPPGTQRSLVLARLESAADASLPLDVLSPAVTIAVARGMLDDAATRNDAITLLESALARDDLGTRWRGAAHVALGRALHEAGRSGEAVDRFVELAECCPTDPASERVIAAAATIARAESTRAPDDAAARTRLRRATDVMLSRYPNIQNVDLWRDIAGRLAIREGRYDDAIACFSGITPDASQWAESRFMLAATRHDQLRETPPSEAVAVARQLQARCASALSVADDPTRRAWLTVYLADALLTLGRGGDALSTLVGADETSGLDAAVVSAVLRKRLEAGEAAGDAGERQREIGRFIDRAPTQVAAIILPLMRPDRDRVTALLAEARDADARALAEERLIPIATRLEPWLASPPAGADAETLAAVRWAIADAYRHAGRCSAALPHLERLLHDQPGALPFIVGRAECLYTSTDDSLGEAMALYKRIAAAGPEVAGENYWLAQLRMLQILDRVQQNTQRIAPRIERLRQTDPTFGGERYKRGFETLLGKYM